MKLKDAFKAFVVGSSVLAFVWTFLYVGQAWRKNRPANFPITWAFVMLPYLFGIVNVLANVIPSKSSNAYTVKMFITGALFGVLLSTIGRFLAKAPEKLDAFGWPDKKWLPSAVAPIFYALIWGLVINFINRTTSVATIF